MAKSKFQKKKEREREVRKKILDRRAAKNAQEKENAKYDAEEKSVRHRQRPIRNEELYAAKRMRDLEIKMQLEHNMKLLEGLQKEYEEELKKREAYLNELKQQADEAQSELAKKLIEELPEQTKEVESIFEDCVAGFAPAPESLAEKATRRLAEAAEKEEKARKKQGKEEFHKFLQETQKKK